MKHQINLKDMDFVGNFPYGIYPQIFSNQRDALLIIGEHGSVTLELPPGSGKTAIAYTFLRTLLRSGRTRLFYITPIKTLVDQVRSFHPDVLVAYGRNEHRCLLYGGEYNAEEVPCSMLSDCPHRVDIETGRTYVGGATPCPYMQQKYEVNRGGRIVVCTVSFYLFSQFFSEERGNVDGLVIDEVHRLAQIVRNSLSYEVSDYHLRCSISLLREIGGYEEADNLENFLNIMMQIIRSKRPNESILLEPDEMRELIRALNLIDKQQLNKDVRDAIRGGMVDVNEHREVLRRIEMLVYDIRRYITNLAYSLPTEDRDPLKYVYSYYTEEREEGRRVQHTLFIKSYYVRPIIQRILSPLTLSMSATVGDDEILGFETGIESPFFTFPYSFPVQNTKILLPTDTPNLALNSRSNRQPTRVLRQIAKACKRFSKKGMRSLVVVVSNRELDKFLFLAGEEGVDVLSYGNGVKPKQIAERFKQGEGDVLAGTAANYGEGIDLPKNIAPVIFFLRPGYPNPRDPRTIFEEKRYRGMRWALWNWRVMMEALQVRGRNIRSDEDLGVTFFISQQFRRFLFHSLSEWLKPAYVGNRSFEQCVREAERLLAK